MKTAIGRGRASVLVIGDEILSGAVQDVNGAYFCRRLAELGLSVRRIEVVSDDIQEISDALRKCCTDSELVLTSGGLGPTSDDVTRDAVASFVGVPLILDRDSLQRMEDKYRERRIPLNKVSNRQVMFPESATVLLNRAGTAECFSVRSDSGALIASFPGIPRELQIVFEEILVPALEKDGIICPPLAAEHIKLFGLSESHIGDQIEKLGLQSSVRIGYRPMFPEILLKLTKPPECTGSSTLQDAVERIVAAIGPEFVLCRSPLDSIADVLGELLIQTQRTVAFAESCTGGLASSLLSARPGASKYFCGAVVAYSNNVKVSQLGVSSETLARHGAVSESCAIEMCRGVRERLKSDIGVSITGVAGPDGGTAEKPVGTVWLGLSTPERELAVPWSLPWERTRIQRYAAQLALDIVRRDLLGYPLHWERK